MNPLTLGQQMAQFGNQASAPNVGTNLLAQALQGYQSQTGPGSQPGGLGGGLGGALPNRGPAITPPAPSFPVAGSPDAGVGYAPPVAAAPAPVAAPPAPAGPSLLPWERPEWVPRGDGAR